MSISVQARLTVEQYLGSLGPSRPGGLIFGYRRPAPRTACPAEDQDIPFRLRSVLARCTVRPVRMAKYPDRPVLLAAPIDAILDRDRALVLHPTAALVLPNRRHLLRTSHQVWGTPNIVIEILWRANARHTRCSKVQWYRTHGVEECWLIDTRTRKVEVFDFRQPGGDVPRAYKRREQIVSRSLAACNFSPYDLFMGAQYEPVRERRRQLRIPDCAARLLGLDRRYDDSHRWF